MLKTLINVVAGIPELIRNPTGTVSSLLGGLTGKAGTSGGLADDLQRSPINAIIVQGTAGSGRIELKKAVVQSPAFEADASGGTVTLAPVLTNSVHPNPGGHFPEPAHRAAHESCSGRHPDQRRLRQAA